VGAKFFIWWWVALHELLLGALRADDIVAVGDESSADQGRLARGADEAVVVPMTVFERDKASAANSWNPTKIIRNQPSASKTCSRSPVPCTRVHAQKILSRLQFLGHSFFFIKK